MAHRFLRDPEADGWERSDFPIICESCLGDCPYVRMTKADYDKECKICTRPFNVFRWRPGRDARYKKTEICRTCCKIKNVLPVQVRDTTLSFHSHDSIPKSDVNREYYDEEQDRKARLGIDYESSYGKAPPSDTIPRLQRTTPYYKRNRAHPCSFYARGKCNRGAECPYRHEMPLTGELSQQNIKDRYYGVNDPVAAKLLKKAGEMPSLAPPNDESIKTLYVGGLDSRVSEQDLRDIFYAHGEIESVRTMVKLACCRGALYKLVIKGLRLKLLWGKSQTQRAELEDQDDKASRQQALTHGGLLPRAVTSPQQHPLVQSPSYFNIPPPPSQTRYPSMDPQRMGALIPSQEGSNNGLSDAQQSKHYPYHQSLSLPTQGHFPPYHLHV
ncbi:hypothetical protein MKW98_003750 [Papaver atlanticum]|uniref:Uncharacterized protein n=1 Tax=Papaver atlanticum TaxID=357466 RepID=A0AAD4T8A3_9MAGN|nr:hypothetical protein MKW98_003750 [Papaver atlanticum]